jgi:hypothetical protein
MKTKEKNIELCSAKVEHLRNELQKQKKSVTNSESPEILESREYKDLQAKIRKLSPNWEYYLDNKPSMDALLTLYDTLAQTDEQAIVDEFRERTGMARATQQPVTRDGRVVSRGR